MTKLISYSLFNSPTAEKFEKMAYIRGFYWNSRMNSFIYPDWRTHLELSRELYSEFPDLFEWLREHNNLDLNINDRAPALCEGMLWRMKPIFTIDVSHVLCRDADSITTYREACSVQRWLEQYNLAVLSLHDNPAHSGLMGGMVGFNTSRFKAMTGLNSWNQLIANRDLSLRGSDQDLLNGLMISESEVVTFWADQHSGISQNPPLPGVESKLWESNLTCRHIGSAGVVDMEVIRFFKRFDIYQWKFDVIEKRFPNIFYWHQ